MKRLVLVMMSVALLAGCAESTARQSDKSIRSTADYWQRADDVSALYMTGPKAQHLLNADLASCVSETRELVRLGSIRNAEPPKTLGMDPSLRAGWNSPTRDGPLYTEYTPFQDFDGCMKTRGWARVDYVRPAVAQAATVNYTETILGHPFGWTGGGNGNVHNNNGIVYQIDPTGTGNFNR